MTAPEYDGLSLSVPLIRPPFTGRRRWFMCLRSRSMSSLRLCMYSLTRVMYGRIQLILIRDLFMSSRRPVTAAAITNVIGTLPTTVMGNDRSDLMARITGTTEQVLL